MSAVPSPSSQGVGILIAEDSPTQAQRLQHILQQQGYGVIRAANGRLALDEARQRKPALIISDVVMPEMDGYELCRQVKADPTLGDVPVILVTTLSDPGDVIRGLECRADNFILKPYEEQYLISRVQYVLMNRVMRQTEQGGLAVEIFFNGQRHIITADRLQILNLLLSTYDAAIQRNKELTRAKEELAARGTVLAQRERELNEATAFLENLIAASPSIIFRLVPAENDFVVTYVSPNIGWVLGYENEEVVGAPHFFRDIIHPDDRETVHSRFQTALSGMTAQLEQEYRWRAKDGGYRWFLTMIRVEYDHQERPVAALCHALDITDRKHAEAQRDRFFSLSLDMLCIAGMDGYFKRLNPSFTRIFGYSTDELLARPFLDFVHPDDRPATVAEVEKLSSGAPTIHFENRYRCQNGEWRWLSWNAQPVAEEGLLYAIARDITDQKAGEQALAAAKLEAERANRAKSDFLSRMSHDLRTPLNAILGFAQLLEMDGLRHDQHDSVRHILKGGEHLLDLINEVLDLARIESGHLSLSPEPVAIGDVVRHVVDLIRPLAAQRRITVDDEGIRTCDGRHLMADRQRLNQILMNLLSNAVKYNRAGGRVAVMCEDVPNDRTRIRVTDTGAGIPPHKLQLLFQPFERLGADQSEVEGTGLGLALSKALAEAMSGTLGVESEIDRGSTFWVELARAEASAGTTAPLRGRPDASAQDSGVSGTVLYIEDNISNRRLMERLLARRAGVRLIAAPDGEAGMDLARAERPDLILLDLHLPDTPGEDVLRRLWEDPRTRAIPVAVLSADANPAQTRRLLAAGARAYLTKPIDIAAVLQLLDETLEKRPSS